MRQDPPPQPEQGSYSSGRVTVEAAGGGEDRPFPQLCDFFRAEFPPPTAPSTPGNHGPQNQGLPLSDQRQPDLLQLFTARTSRPRTEGSSWGKSPASPGGVNIYTTWCVGRGGQREVAGLRQPPDCGGKEPAPWAQVRGAQGCQIPIPIRIPTSDRPYFCPQPSCQR